MFTVVKGREIIQGPAMLLVGRKSVCSDNCLHWLRELCIKLSRFL